MGGLNTFNLDEFIDLYNIGYFVETGVGMKANGINYASRYDFKKIYSVDIDEVYYSNAVEKFKNDERVEIHFKKSIDFLDEILPLNGNTLFWLDAHFPDFYVAGHYHKNISLQKYKNEIPEDIRMPLENELDVISKKDNFKNNVFIIDDYRCYEPETGNFGHGIHPNRHLLGCSKDSSFFDRILGPTHNIRIDRRHSGYLIATPK